MRATVRTETASRLAFKDASPGKAKRLNSVNRRLENAAWGGRTRWRQCHVRYVQVQQGEIMGMVFCRGCGKEIHESAPFCPLCGAPQAVPPTGRSAVKLVGLAIVWWLVFWFGSLFLAGAVAGVFNPQDAHEAGARAGQMLSGPLFLISLCASIVLTVLGKLPGTKKPLSMPRQNA
jgi:hypothetical protein